MSHLTGADVVGAHVDAFNAHDIEALLAGFAAGAVWATGTDTIEASELRDFFVGAFEHLTPHLEVDRIIDGGATVVAQLQETWTHGMTRTASIVGIYDIADGFITSAKIYREGSADA